MSTCVPTHALLSALVRRITHDGVLPPESDFVALRQLGITREEILRAIEAQPVALSADARARALRVWSG
jgi:hypothetical protein